MENENIYMTPFENLGTGLKEMQLFFLTHHIKHLSTTELLKYELEGRKVNLSGGNYMKYLCDILIENGFDPYTNTKKKSPLDTPPQSIIRLKAKPNKKVKQTYVKKIKAPLETNPKEKRNYFKEAIKRDMKKFGVTEDEAIQMRLQPKLKAPIKTSPAKQKKRNYDQEAINRYINIYGLTKEEAIEAREHTRKNKNKKSWKNYISKK